MDYIPKSILSPRPAVIFDCRSQLFITRDVLIEMRDALSFISIVTIPLQKTITAMMHKLFPLLALAAVSLFPSVAKAEWNDSIRYHGEISPEANIPHFG